MSKTGGEEQASICLADVLDLKAAQPLLSQIAAVRGADLLIDASNVSYLGAQCLQILFSAAATWRADEAMLTLHDPEGSFATHVAALGDRFDPHSLEELCA